MTDVPTGNGRVQLAYLHEENVSHSWHDSMRRLRDYDQAHDGRLLEKPLNIRCNTGRLVQSRNFATKLFLDNTDAEWLWWCDTDMGFEPDALDRLMQAADPLEAPVVGALAFAMMESGFDGMGGMRFRIVPTMYMMGHAASDGHASFCFYGPYPDDTVVQVAGTGAAFILIHRSVLEKIRAEHGDNWFSQVADETGDVIGEDLSFCLRVGALGLPVFVHTGVKTNHHKQVWIQEEDYRLQPLVRVEDSPAPDLPMEIHLAASLATLVDPAWGQGPMLKLDTDLQRYQEIIAATKPEVIVEAGTYTGASAVWLAEESGAEIITIDINPNSAQAARELAGRKGLSGRIVALTGSSIDPAIVGAIEERVGDRRCMVVLDSDHSTAHVAAEIELYGPLVTAGCYLVVEDTVFGYAPDQILRMHYPNGLTGSPLEPVAELLHGNDAWSRDVAIERAYPTSHHPAGWWVRNG